MLLCVLGTGKMYADTVIAKWDWQNASPSSITSTNIQGVDASGTVDSDVDGIQLNVLAAVTGTNIKLQYISSGYAQYNQNTAIRVPVISTSDVVTVVSYPGQSNYTVGGEDATGQNTFSHTATSSEVNKGYVEIVATATAYLYSITVVQDNDAGSYTTVYNLATAIAANGNIENASGSLAPTTAVDAANAPDIAVDATGSGAKLGANGDWAQIQPNTVLTLAGVPNGATLTFVLYDNTGITINGTEYTNGQTFTSTKNQNITMTCTTGGYIKTITVVGTAFVDLQDDSKYTNTWYFGKSNGAPEFALEKSAEYEYTVNEHSIIVNTASGKLNNASRTDQWAQCNDGTLFKVPVYAGSKLTWGKLSSGSTIGFTINDQLYNTYYIATEDVTVNMSATNIAWISYIKIEPADLYEISGTISGGSVDGAAIKLTATNGQVYEATIASSAFTATVPADTYSVSLSGTSSYVVSSPSSVTVSEEGSIGTINVIEAVAQTVSGTIANAPSEGFVLTFTATSNSSNSKTLNCSASATSYTIDLMPDTYTMSSNVGTLSTISAAGFQVVSDAVSHNIYFPETVPAATQQNITVDNTLASATPNNYKSVSDALTAAKAGSISSPIITLTSGQTYREQVIVDQANVTLKTSGADKATITFYYGIGYGYYSLNADGYYDKDRAMTRNSKLTVSPARWGATILVRSTGSGFYAENIIFENSFNQYYTTEEVADGVAPNGLESITYDRTLTSGDAGYKAADARAVTERAAAIGFENSPTGCEVYNCTFISSQDTYYTSGTLYAKNCTIQGNTDYIFGGGSVVFDNCNLVIGGYSDQEAAAYITAYKDKDGEPLKADKKYIFRDCSVTKTNRTYIKGNLGRDWGGTAASVYYFNLDNTIGSDFTYGWSDMGGAVTAGTADLHIYDFDPIVNANYSTTGSTGANINGVVSDADALDIYANVVSFLGFTPQHIYDDNVELGESSAYNTSRIAASNNVERTVNLTRAISAGKWSTIVLPFAMTEAKLKAAFGNDVKVAELSDASTDNNLSFSSVTSTEANKPYAIKVTSAFASATIEDVTIAEATPTQESTNWNFVGTYAASTIPTASFYFSNNTLKKAGATGTHSIKPFRAYFTYTGAGEIPNSLPFSIDDEATAINNVNDNANVNNVDGAIYTISGQRVSQLVDGVNIINGNKVVK